MITFPWISSCDTSSAKRDNYYFSNQRNWFEYIVIELYSKKSGLWQGFIVFSLSRHKQRTVLKALDHRLISPVNPAVLLETTLFTAEQIGVDCIELSADWDTDYTIVSDSNFMIKKKKRSYCYYPGDPQGLLQDALFAIHLDYCDGDIAFT